MADREGSADAISMRRVAAELQLPVMSLYRHVGTKDELLTLVIDSVFGAHPLPSAIPVDWREGLASSAIHEWQIYRGRQWLVPLVATTEMPVIAINLMRYTDWRLRALDRTQLPRDVALSAALTLSAFIFGCAQMLARPDDRPRDGARTQQRSQAIQNALTSGVLPAIARFGESEYRSSRPAAVFEFGLDRVLDGIAQTVAAHDDQG